MQAKRNTVEAPLRRGFYRIVALMDIDGEAEHYVDNTRAEAMYRVTHLLDANYDRINITFVEY